MSRRQKLYANAASKRLYSLLSWLCSWLSLVDVHTRSFVRNSHELFPTSKQEATLVAEEHAKRRLKEEVEQGKPWQKRVRHQSQRPLCSDTS